MKIVVFDSGVGGFSILRELQSTPHSYLYLADQAFFPYGQKSTDQLKKRLTLIGNWLKQQAPDLVVMACNTATVNGISLLRQVLTCPIIGVEPVVKPAAKYQKALIIGTQLTLHSSRMQELLSTHPGSISTFCPHGLAEAVENINIELMKSIIQEIKKIIQKENIEALGLSCTHYPLITDMLKKELPEIAIIDPSQAVAVRALQILKLNNSMKIKNYKLKINFYTTGDMLRFNYQITHYLGLIAESRKVVI